MPLVISPKTSTLNLLSWSYYAKEWIDALLLQHGALLFRNFSLPSIDDFEAFIQHVSASPLLEYTYRSTPRRSVSGRLYTSTEYPADQIIPLHNENSYSTSWPMKIFFFCVQAADSGGETPIANSHTIFSSLDPTIKEQFILKQILYVRNYGDVDLPLDEVFQTNKKHEIEQICKQLKISYQWKGTEKLRTQQLCPAVTTHPILNKELWFNQAHLFHSSMLKPEVRQSLLSLVGESNLPRNAYFGDGMPIEDSIINEINNTYHDHMIKVAWEKGDVLMLDNMQVAHGRMSFKGPRKIVVGMS